MTIQFEQYNRGVDDVKIREISFFGPKGRNVIAQANGLGTGHRKIHQALKGRQDR